MELLVGIRSQNLEHKKTHNQIVAIRKYLQNFKLK